MAIILVFNNLILKDNLLKVLASIINDGYAGKIKLVNNTDVIGLNLI